VETMSEFALSAEELQLAARNHAMPLEMLREPITPIGMHYLLIHFDIPAVDAATWRLQVGGKVVGPLTLTLDDVKARPARTQPVTLECAGNGRALFTPRAAASQPWLLEAVGTGEWTGTPLGPILEEAGVADSAVEVVFTGLDRGVQGDVEQLYEWSLPLAEAMREEVLLAYELNGRPLPPQHGFPVRLLVPGWYGMANVKWLQAITVVDEPFEGWQQTVSYRLKSSEEDPGTPVTRILPRSLMVPPGFPDFMTRTRFVEAGAVRVQGRAWSGRAPIESVQFSADGGRSWHDAELEQPLADFAWRGWSFEWQAEPGEHELCCRAVDAAGNAQPDTAGWNYGGFCNNSLHRVHAVVR
jgi:DMSO/TMAO reductase YedYZ molybdopterin-dependent catalytic subunit